MADENSPLTPEQMAARIAELEGRLAKGSKISFRVLKKEVFQFMVWAGSR
jgi:hypothetical protein